MLRILIVATLLVLVTATSVQAGSAEMRDGGLLIELQIVGAAVGGAQTALQPAVRASIPTIVMYRTINGVAHAQPVAGSGTGMLSLFNLDDKSGLALPVSDSVSLGLRYQYLRREDMQLDVAEIASLDDGYASHNVLLHARWHF